MDVPLVFVSLAEATPLNTELKGMFRIELSVVDREEMPKVVLPLFNELAASLP